MTAGTSPPSIGRSQGLSIGIKIFGIATSLLGLLILVVYVFTDRLRQVNEEVTALAEYVIPITDLVAAIDVHALEQELHFERVQKLYEIEPVNLERIARELAIFCRGWGLDIILTGLEPDAQIRGINDYLSLISVPITQHTGASVKAR